MSDNILVRVMTEENDLGFDKTLPQKIDHLITQFGSNSPIVQAYRRIEGLAGENPTRESLENALTQVEQELDQGLFKPKP